MTYLNKIKIEHAEENPCVWLREEDINPDVVKCDRCCDFFDNEVLTNYNNKVYCPDCIQEVIEISAWKKEKINKDIAEMISIINPITNQRILQGII